MGIIKVEDAKIDGVHAKILELKKDIDIAYIKLGYCLKYVNDTKAYLEVDCQTFDEYLAQPELAFERSTAYAIMGVYADFIETGLSETLDIAGIPYYKLDRIRQFKDEPVEKFKEWVEKARELSLSDLNIEICAKNGKEVSIEENTAKWFVHKMEEALEANKWKTPWTKEERKVLYQKAVKNLFRIQESTNKEVCIKSLIDTANYCMFIADKLRRE